MMIVASLLQFPDLCQNQDFNSRFYAKFGNKPALPTGWRSTTDGYYAFEIKMAEHVSATDARHLARLGPILDKPLLGSFILSNDPETKILDKDVVAVNATMFLG